MQAYLLAAVLMAGTLHAAHGYAEDIEGVVKVVGSALARKVMIHGKDSTKHRLCDNDVTKKVSRLTGMTVQVAGDWTMRKAEKLCFTGETFAVKKVSSGREALVGVLTHSADGYEVKGDGGKVHVFAQVPDGLKKLVGQKVIIDMRPMNTPTSQGTAYSVVTYSPFP